MITIPQVMAQTLGAFLAAETRGRFGASHSNLADFLPYVSRLTLECIGNSDALYHDIEHSMLVALVGHDILMGRALLRSTTPRDYSNFILACLTHDIGYVRGVVQGDGDGAYVADVNGRTVKLPIGSSDAALAPYHVDRSKLFVIERFDTVEFVDADRIAQHLMREPGSDLSRADNNLSAMLTHIDHAGDIVRRMRSFIRRGHPHVSTINTRDMLEEAMALAQAEASAHGQDFARAPFDGAQKCQRSLDGGFQGLVSCG